MPPLNERSVSSVNFNGSTTNNQKQIEPSPQPPLRKQARLYPAEVRVASNARLPKAAPAPPPSAPRAAAAAAAQSNGRAADERSHPRVSLSRACLSLPQPVDKREIGIEIEIESVR